MALVNRKRLRFLNHPPRAESESIVYPMNEDREKLNSRRIVSIPDCGNPDPPMQMLHSSRHGKHDIRSMAAPVRRAGSV